MTVLAVEDEPLILDMISQELTDQGSVVLEADTGRMIFAIGTPLASPRADILPPHDDHPADAETIGDYAEAPGKERLAERHFALIRRRRAP